LDFKKNFVSGKYIVNKSIKTPIKDQLNINTQVNQITAYNCLVKFAGISIKVAKISVKLGILSVLLI
jgi:hypothetical protein